MSSPFRFANPANTDKPDLKAAIHKAVELRETFEATCPGVVDEVIRQYRLEHDGFHGPAHWERVLVNCLLLQQVLPNYVCEHTAFLFALFHDSRRFDEGTDINHGRRGADYFLQMYETGELPLETGFFSTIADFEAMKSRAYRAMAYHTTSRFENDPKVASCLDGDRLDLMRVGIYPDINRLHYQSAISDSLIYACSMRARNALDTPIFRRAK